MKLLPEPWLLYSTDDTTEYIYDGTKKAYVPYVLTTGTSITKQGTHAVYKCEDDKSMSGMCVKMTFTFSAMGTCFPLVCTDTGLTEREMSTGNKFIHVKVPGLCIGGSGVNINNQEVGHLLFMRNAEGVKKKKFLWYQQNVLFPGINDHHKRFAKFDASLMSLIPNKLTAVSYCDGDFSQIDVIKSSIDLIVDNKVIAYKQHASRLAVKQAADVGNPFKLIKSMLPSYSFQHIPAVRCPMKALMIYAFKEQLNDDLNLAANKMKSLIDFISTLLEMGTKACYVTNIQHGFIITGQIDGTNMRFPVFDTILSTCRRIPKKEEYENIEKNMANDLYHSSDYGHILEDVYDQMGIVRDRDSMGYKVLHEATISQESYQRTKCLTHEHQIHLRKERLALTRVSKDRGKS